MTEMTLQAEIRDNLGGAQSKNILQESYLPAIIYGPGRENSNIKIKYQEFLNVFQKVGRAQIINLKVGDQEHKVLVHDIQRSPLTDKVIHIDFYEFQKDHKFSVQVPLVFNNESRAVKEAGGLLVTHLDRINVECLAENLISEIKVDLSKLENINDSIYISDLEISKDVEILDAEDEVVVSVEAPKTIEEEKELQEESLEKQEDKVEEGEEKEAGDKAETGEEKEAESGDKVEEKK